MPVEDRIETDLISVDEDHAPTQMIKVGLLLVVGKLAVLAAVAPMRMLMLTLMMKMLVGILWMMMNVELTMKVPPKPQAIRN